MKSAQKEESVRKNKRGRGKEGGDTGVDSNGNSTLTLFSPASEYDPSDATTDIARVLAEYTETKIEARQAARARPGDSDEEKYLYSLMAEPYGFK